MQEPVSVMFNKGMWRIAEDCFTHTSFNDIPQTDPIANRFQCQNEVLTR